MRQDACAARVSGDGPHWLVIFVRTAVLIPVSLRFGSFIREILCRRLMARSVSIEGRRRSGPVPVDVFAGGPAHRCPPGPEVHAHDLALAHAPDAAEDTAFTAGAELLERELGASILARAG
jgi:hypothetical protein